MGTVYADLTLIGVHSLIALSYKLGLNYHEVTSVSNNFTKHPHIT